MNEKGFFSFFCAFLFFPAFLAFRALHPQTLRVVLAFSFLLLTLFSSLLFLLDLFLVLNTTPLLANDLLSVHLTNELSN